MTAPRFAASAYRAHRPGYPEALFRSVLDELPPPHRRAVDLGAGTGLSTAPLCSWFEEVVAVEPDPDMARSLASLSPKVEVRSVSAEEHDEAPASVDVVTSGNAFYWMDGPEIVGKVARWLRPAGMLVVYRYGFPHAPRAVQPLLSEELSHRWGAYVHARLLDADYSQRVIESSGAFAAVQKQLAPNDVWLDAQQLVGFFRSTSFGSAYLETLPDGEAYLEGLERRIAAAAGPDPFPVDFGLEIIVARR